MCCMRESGCGCVRREPGNNWLSRHPHLPHPATGGVGSAMTPPSTGPPPKTVDRSVQMSLGTHTGKGQDTLVWVWDKLHSAMYASSPEKAHPTQGGADQLHARRVLARDPGNQGPRPTQKRPTRHHKRPTPQDHWRAPTPVPHHHQLRQRPRHSSPAPREPPEPSSPRLYLFKSDELLMHSLKVGIVKC